MFRASPLLVESVDIHYKIAPSTRSCRMSLPSFGPAAPHTHGTHDLNSLPQQADDTSTSLPRFSQQALAQSSRPSHHFRCARQIQEGHTTLARPVTVLNGRWTWPLFELYNATRNRLQQETSVTLSYYRHRRLKSGRARTEEPCQNDQLHASLLILILATISGPRLARSAR